MAREFSAFVSVDRHFCSRSLLQEHKNAGDHSFGWRCQADCLPDVVACVGQRSLGCHPFFPAVQKGLQAIVTFDGAKGMFRCFFPDLLACLVPLDGDPDCFFGAAFSMKRMVVGTDDIIHWKLL